MPKEHAVVPRNLLNPLNNKPGYCVEVAKGEEES